MQWDVFERAFGERHARSPSATRSRRSTASAAPTCTPTSAAVAAHEPLRLAVEPPLRSTAARRARPAVRRRDARRRADPRSRPSSPAPDAPDNALGDRRAGRPAPRRACIDDLLRRTTQGRWRCRSSARSCSPISSAASIDLLDHGTITSRRRRAGAGACRATSPSSCRRTPRRTTSPRRCAAPASRPCAPAPGSVLASPAVLQWRLLLAALARPHHAPSVRAAALGWFLRHRRRAARRRRRRRSADRVCRSTRAQHRRSDAPAGRRRRSTTRSRRRQGIAARRRRSVTPTATATSPISTTSPSCSPQRTARWRQRAGRRCCACSRR